MTNISNGIQREIKVKGQKLGTVTSFKYLGAVVSDNGYKPEILSRIAQATAALTKLKPICRDNNISFGSKVKLMRSLVFSIYLYACEAWALAAELEKRAQAFEMRCYHRLKTGQDGKGLLQIHLWYPDDRLRLWDKIE